MSEWLSMPLCSAWVYRGWKQFVLPGAALLGSKPPTSESATHLCRPPPPTAHQLRAVSAASWQASQGPPSCAQRRRLHSACLHVNSCRANVYITQLIIKRKLRCCRGIGDSVTATKWLSTCCQLGACNVRPRTWQQVGACGLHHLAIHTAQEVLCICSTKQVCRVQRPCRRRGTQQRSPASGAGMNLAEPSHMYSSTTAATSMVLCHAAVIAAYAHM